MEFDDLSKPMDTAAQAELDRIYRDPTHQHHVGFWRGDKASVDYRDQLMARVDTRERSIGETDSRLEEQMGKALNNPPAATKPESQPVTNKSDAGFVSPEVEQRELQAAEWALRELWGDQHDAKREQLNAGAVYVAERYPDIFNDVALKSLGNDPRIIEAVRLIGENLQRR